MTSVGELDTKRSSCVYCHTVLSAACLIRTHHELVGVCGALLSICVDDDPGFKVHALAEGAQKKGIALQSIEPGKPTQNAYVGRFNKICRTEVIDCCVFDNLQKVREMTSDLLNRINHH